MQREEALFNGPMFLLRYIVALIRHYEEVRYQTWTDPQPPATTLGPTCR